MYILFALLSLPFLYGDNSPRLPMDDEPLVSPKVVEAEIRDAQKEFSEAKKMFNPWYTGPLLTPSASIAPYHRVNIQPYLFYTNNYAYFDNLGRSHKTAHLNILNPQLSPIQMGITDHLDIGMSTQAVWQHTKGEGYTNLGDTSLTLGYALFLETPYRPGIKVALKESFPTGKYQKFSEKKSAVESTGSGSFATTLSATVSKVVWWVSTHPMGFRASAQCTIPSNVHVKGFNSYGGGPGTKGVVHVGNTFSLDFGYEYSFTQNWVGALDIAYSHSWKTTFKGTTTGSVGSLHSTDQLSIAPALEYNLSGDVGFIAGIWFTVWGRNTPNFLSEIISFTYTF